MFAQLVTLSRPRRTVSRRDQKAARAPEAQKSNLRPDRLRRSENTGDRSIAWVIYEARGALFRSYVSLSSCLVISPWGGTRFVLCIGRYSVLVERPWGTLADDVVKSELMKEVKGVPCMFCICVTSFFTDVEMYVVNAVLVRGESRGILKKFLRLNACKELDAKHRSDCLGKGAKRTGSQEMQLICVSIIFLYIHTEKLLHKFWYPHFYCEFANDVYKKCRFFWDISSVIEIASRRVNLGRR